MCKEGSVGERAQVGDAVRDDGWERVGVCWEGSVGEGARVGDAVRDGSWEQVEGCWEGGGGTGGVARELGGCPAVATTFLPVRAGWVLSGM
jgi:hypothetical protein